MQFPDKYFENEIREGFFVPSMVKRAWAAELEVLSEIDRICRKYNIQYFAEWGTLLGAVRHNGFIPWDDDLDIGMKRADYEKFLKVAEKELPEGYRINNLRTKDDFWLFLARVMNTGHMCFEDEYLKKFHEFPYIAGVDIFIMDFVSRDEKKEKNRDTLADYVITLADCIAERKITAGDALLGLSKIESIGFCRLDYYTEYIRNWLENTDIDIDEALGKYIDEFHQRMYAYAERLFAVFSDEESDELTQLFPFGLRSCIHRYPKEYYKDCIRIPFENMTIPVPMGYDAMLKRRYGDYMSICKKWTGHTYPFYESQQAELDAILDVKLPSYQYTDTEAKLCSRNYSEDNKKSYNSGDNITSFKAMAIDACSRLKDYSNPENSQALAIELGTMIESVYGEGHPTVTLLEAYCEQMYVIASKGEENAELGSVLNSIDRSIKEHVLNRKEAVFIVCKVSEWVYVRREYERVSEDEAYDVYVVPVPYYFKRYDGTLYNMHDEYCAFEKMLQEVPGNVHLTRYDDYEVSLHHPEIIYIQNPYDEWDAGISIHPHYYSGKLKENCDRLVYIPPFVLDEFDEGNHCEYHNLGKYALVPGVVRADCVLVQSEKMKQTYVKRLTEWAGEGTRHIWEDKISGAGTQLKDCDMASTRQQSAMNDIPDEWKKVIYTTDGVTKKIILYHVELCFFIQNKENAFKKIRSAFEVFRKNMDNVALIWNFTDEVEKIIERNMPKWLSDLQNMKALAGEIGICDISDGRRAAAICDAYYGDGCYLSRLCQIDKKPVMIENVDIVHE